MYRPLSDSDSKALARVQQADLDPALAEHALAWSRQMLRPEYRGSAFGPEVPVAPDAPAYQRLAGWFGRDPRWAPALCRSGVCRR